MRKRNCKKAAAALMAAALSTALLAGCGSTAPVDSTPESVAVSEAAPAQSTEEGDADEMAARNCADLIDAIYVQTRTEDTDAQCEAAKAAWDALTDTQKEMVEGENADPDYFGRDTGDAALDDPRNADDIGENELLVVSFGTSFNGSRAADIKGIEDALQAAYPDWSVRRAFTAQIIINHVQARDGEKIDNMQQALDRAVANGVKNLVVQPTHLMNGLEYTDLKNELAGYSDSFEKIALGEPLLTSDDDFQKVMNAIVDATKEYDDGETAICFMGHGTEADSNSIYTKMQETLTAAGPTNYFVGTVEATPSLDDVIAAVKEAGYTTVVLRPLMVVAGDHANNDMAGADEDSWKTMFEAAGFTVNCQISGLGRIADVQALYVAHTKAAIDAIA